MKPEGQRPALKRILFVDDDLDMRLITQLSLERIGQFEVLSCAEGREALNQVEDFGPDLILLDAMIPDLNGPDILAALRAQPEVADIPVIFLTARSEPEDIATLKQLGALEVLTKPFDPLKLSENLLAIWRRRNRN